MRNDGKDPGAVSPPPATLGSKPRRSERKPGLHSLHLDWNAAVVRGPWFPLMGQEVDKRQAVGAADGTALSWPSDARRLLGSAARSARVGGLEKNCLSVYAWAARRTGVLLNQGFLDDARHVEAGGSRKVQHRDGVSLIFRPWHGLHPRNKS